MLLVLVVLACGQSTETSTAANSGQEIDTLDAMGVVNLQLPNLITGAQPIVDDWSIFDDLETELVQINALPLADVRSRMERLITFSDSLGKTIPDTLFVQPIKSRLIVVKTRIRLLDQAVNSGRPSNEKIKTCFEEMNESWEFFKIQINEKLLKDSIDQQRKEGEKAELEKQRAKLVSISITEN